MSKKNKSKKQKNKALILFSCLFIGFVSGVILGVGLREIPVTHQTTLKEL